MMKVGIGDGPYRKRYGVEKGYEKLRSIGYECIDYQPLAETEAPLYQGGEKQFEAMLTQDRKRIESLGMEVCQVHGPWRFPPQDATEEDRAERFEKMSMGIRGAAILGSPYFVIHPIMPWGLCGGPDPAEFHRLNLEFMSRLAEEGRKSDVIVCLENMPMVNLPLGTPEACLDFVKEIDHPYLKMCLDTGHCTMFEINPADSVRNLGKDYLRTLHLHDNSGKQDLHWVPLSGVIDWEDFRNALKEIGFDGCVSLETAPPAKFTGEMMELQERSLYLSACYLAGRE